MADSWKTDGDCSVCRRQNYCSKTCTKARHRMEKDLRAKALELILNKKEAR